MKFDGKKSIRLNAELYRKLIQEAKTLKRTFAGHLEDIVEKHFKRSA